MPLASRKSSLTVIVPLFQEEDGVAKLAQGLARFHASERDIRDVDFVLVDDGSTDRTAELLRTHFADWPARILTHERNRGLTAALATGLTAARGDYVGWLDSDLTYEPEALSGLAAQLDAGADVACTSCYHPQGQVVGVPRWRLHLSQTASRLYRRLTRVPLHTFTGMVRVYRHEVLVRCPMARSGFLGVTEVLLKAIRAGYRVVEAPAVLRVRSAGTSKMRTFRVGKQHLRLMWDWLRDRL